MHNRLFPSPAALRTAAALPGPQKSACTAEPPSQPGRSAGPHQTAGPSVAAQETAAAVTKKSLACPFEHCQKRFIQRGSLHKHLATHSHDRPRFFACPRKNCNKDFYYPYDLQRHLYTHTQHRRFACPREGCTKRFAYRCNIKRHLMEQAAKRTLACPHEGCASAFARNSALARHLNRHAGVKPFPCAWPDCQKRFGQRYDLTRHMRQHTGERPFACSYPGCTKKFIQSSALKIHSRTHNEDAPLRCPYEGCTRTFAKRGGLQTHCRFHIRDTLVLREHAQYAAALVQKSDRNIHGWQDPGKQGLQSHSLTGPLPRPGDNSDSTRHLAPVREECVHDSASRLHQAPGAPPEGSTPVAGRAHDAPGLAWPGALMPPPDDDNALDLDGVLLSALVPDSPGRQETPARNPGRSPLLDDDDAFWQWLIAPDAARPDAQGPAARHD